MHKEGLISAAALRGVAFDSVRELAEVELAGFHEAKMIRKADNRIECGGGFNPVAHSADPTVNTLKHQRTQHCKSSAGVKRRSTVRELQKRTRLRGWAGGRAGEEVC
jgi:hypothetical protein